MIVSTTELLLEPKKHRLLTPTGHAYASVPIFTFERRGIATSCLIEAKKNWRGRVPSRARPGRARSLLFL